MTFSCLAAGRNFIILAVASAALAAGVANGRAVGGFPYDRDLLLDTEPMRPAKRVPILNVASDGGAIIDLWCKTVSGRVQLSESAIRIETGPLPEGLPTYMSEGQCTPERMQADQDMLAALVLVTNWERRGNTVLLNGGASLRFRLSDH